MELCVTIIVTVPNMQQPNYPLLLFVIDLQTSSLYHTSPPPTSDGKYRYGLVTTIAFHFMFDLRGKSEYLRIEMKFLFNI